MLSHGLRRRKRRAWQAVMRAAGHQRVISATRSTDRARRAMPRPGSFVVRGRRWCWSCCRLPERVLRGRRPADPVAGAVGAVGLAVADMVIGVTYLRSPAAWTATTRSPQRLQSAIYSLVGFAGPVQFAAETRGRPLRPADRARSGCFTLRRRRRTCSCARPGRRAGCGARGRDRDPASCWTSYGATGLARLLRAARRQEHDLVAHRQVLHRLPGAVRASCWPAATRSATRRPGRARSTRSWMRRPGTPGCPP